MCLKNDYNVAIIHLFWVVFFITNNICIKLYDDDDKYK